MLTDDSRSHWRVGAYSLEHEIVTSGSISSSLLLDLQWKPKQADESISFYFDEPTGRLVASGVLVSLYGLTSSPTFGLRLRVKEALVWDGEWRHGVSITMPLRAHQAAAAESFRCFAGTYVADSLKRHVSDLGMVTRQVAVTQKRQRWLLQEPEGSEFVNLSQDIVTFETAGGAVTHSFVEISTYAWPIRSSYLSAQIHDTLNAIDGRAVRSKIEWFQERGEA